MPQSPAFELQVALVGRLKGFAAVTAIAQQRVYDRVPRNASGQVNTAEFPYVSIGPMDDVPEDADCIRSSEITIQLDVWSRFSGKTEAQKLCWAVRQALTGWEFTLAENALVNFEYSGERIFLDADGLTTHGVITVTALVEVNL